MSQNQTSDKAQVGPGLRVKNTSNAYATDRSSAGKGIPSHNPSGQPNSVDRGNSGRGRG